MDRLWRIVPIFACLLADSSARVVPAQDRVSRSARVPLSEDSGATIHPAIIAEVVDDTLGLTSDDREAYFKMLKLARMVEPEDLRLFAQDFRQDRHATFSQRRRSPVEKFPAFVDLFQHPLEYRGHPVTMQGVLRRLVTFDAGPNAQGIETLYEGWLYPDDGQSNPVVVVFSEKPDGLPLGVDITEKISATGYFLKMYGYQAQDSLRKAPLILASGVEWHPQQTGGEIRLSNQMTVAITIIVAIVCLIIGVGMRESSLQQLRDRAIREAKYAEFIAPESLGTDRLAAPSLNGVSRLEPHH